MSEANGTAGSDEATRRGRDLHTALRKARVVEAERSDVVVDLRAAEVARLELLREEISAVVRQVPAEHASLFDGGLVPGFPPRLWIDILTFVEMSRDKRAYRLLRDGRDGRVCLYECADLAEMADRITDFIAHRIIERERALQSGGTYAAAPVPEPLPPPPSRANPEPAARSREDEPPRMVQATRGASSPGLWARLAAAAAPIPQARSDDRPAAIEDTPRRQRAEGSRGAEPERDAGYASPAWRPAPARADDAPNSVDGASRHEFDDEDRPRRSRVERRDRFALDDEDAGEPRGGRSRARGWGRDVEDAEAAPRSRRRSELDEEEVPRQSRGQGEFRRSGWRGMSPLKAFLAGLLVSGALIGLALVALMQLGLGR